MAENLQILKNRIKSASNISKIAKAMEMISASKIKKAQDAVENNRPYSEKITEIVEKALASVDLESFSHEYLKINNSNKKLLVAISPDKGLCGSLPTNLTKKLSELIDKDTLIITIGKKIAKFASKSGGQLIASFPMGTALPQYSNIFPIIDLINQYFMGGKVGSVAIVLTEFKSIFLQVPHVTRLLPLIPAIDQTNIEKIEPTGYSFEPNINVVLQELLPYFIEVKLYYYLIHAFTSEQAARMIAMQNAKNNALDIADFLTLTYNKARQAKITNELLDLANLQYI